jgi:formylmethanofuran dehydrogenase subunit D
MSYPEYNADVTLNKKVIFRDNAGNTLVEEHTMSGKKYVMAYNNKGQMVVEKDFKALTKKAGIGVHYKTSNGKLFAKAKRKR